MSCGQQSNNRKRTPRDLSSYVLIGHQLYLLAPHVTLFSGSTGTTEAVVVGVLCCVWGTREQEYPDGQIMSVFHVEFIWVVVTVKCPTIEFEGEETRRRRSD